MSNEDRQFAIDVVQSLRSAGHEALWAGGCVRDSLLGLEPKDFDVATNATPDQIRDVFGHLRTLSIGAAFGVITVVGKTSEGQIEVATFRQDAAYSDGRHPDSVTFSTAKEDAQRRDFTINGLFYDPLADEVIDYVSGQDDLRRKLVRAIGDPFERIDEDKLRMLRAVRFATTLDFELDEATLSAVQRQAAQIAVVSAERIAAELRRLLADSNRVRGVELLRQSGLLHEILPEADALIDEAGFSAGRWQRTLDVLAALQGGEFPVALAALLREIHSCNKDAKLPEAVCRRWKLSNEETAAVKRLLADEALIRNAPREPWPRLQRVLVQEGIVWLLELSEAVARVYDGSTTAIDFCREKLRLPPDELNPPSLLNGDDLKQQGVPPGPRYREILESVRDLQLDGHVRTRDEAIAAALKINRDDTSAYE